MPKNSVTLIPVAQTRVCDKCGAYTWWATARQKTKGRCFDCLPYSPDSPEQYDAALRLLLTTFPGSTVIEPRQYRYPPGGYAGPDAGPCRGCGGQVRVYGEYAYPFCTTCQPVNRGDQ